MLSQRALGYVPPPKPEDYEHRLAGIRTHNRWLEDFCGQFPERRAGIGQMFVNNIDDLVGCKDSKGAATGMPDFPTVTTEVVDQCSPVSEWV